MILLLKILFFSENEKDFLHRLTDPFYAKSQSKTTFQAFQFGDFIQQQLNVFQSDVLKHLSPQKLLLQFPYTMGLEIVDKLRTRLLC